jgi:hypothetical protein
MKLNALVRNSLIALAVLALMIFLNTIDFHDAIDQSQATKIAEQKLAAFIKKRELIDYEFRKPDIRTAGAGWEIYYEGVGKNNLLVNILVGKTGGSELHSTNK